MYNAKHVKQSDQNLEQGRQVLRHFVVGLSRTITSAVSDLCRYEMAFLALGYFPPDVNTKYPLFWILPCKEQWQCHRLYGRHACPCWRP